MRRVAVLQPSLLTHESGVCQIMGFFFASHLCVSFVDNFYFMGFLFLGLQTCIFCGRIGVGVSRSVFVSCVQQFQNEARFSCAWPMVLRMVIFIRFHLAMTSVWIRGHL